MTAESADEAGGVLFHRALPHDRYTPARRSERLPVGPIPLNVPLNLRPPIGGV